MNPRFATPLIISLEEFEKAITKGWLIASKDTIIQPILQLWGKLDDGRFRATGYLAITGLVDKGVIVTAYSADSIERMNARYEKEKFKELIELTIGEYMDFTMVDFLTEEF